MENKSFLIIELMLSKWLLLTSTSHYSKAQPKDKRYE